MRIPLPNNALEKQKSLFLRYHFKGKRLNRESCYCTNRRIKLARENVFGSWHGYPHVPSLQPKDWSSESNFVAQGSCQILFSSRQQPGSENINWVWAVPPSSRPQGPFPSCERHLAFGSCCDYREGPACKVPPSTPRAATAAPSSEAGSQQWVRLELQWQDPAKRLWLSIKLMLFIKNAFSITRGFSHPDLNIPEISQGQPCTVMSLSHIATPWSDDFFFCLWAQSRAALCKHQVGHTPQ